MKAKEQPQKGFSNGGSSKPKVQGGAAPHQKQGGNGYANGKPRSRGVGAGFKRT